MAKLAIKKGSTDQTIYVFAQDSSKTTGEGLASLSYNTESLVAYYVRPLGSASAITLATQTVTGEHSDGGFVEVDATNMPGVYRLDLPDAVCATGVPSVVVMLSGAENMAPVLLEIQLTDFDMNAAAITAAGIADAVWDEELSGHAVSGTAGDLIGDELTDLQSLLANIGSGITTIDNFLDTEIAAILEDTNEIQAELADGGRLDLIIDAIVEDTGTTLDALVKDIPTNAELATALGTADDAVLAAVAAAKVVIDDIHDTDLPAVKTETAAIKAKTDNLPADPADDSDIDTQLDAIKIMLTDVHDTDLPAIKADTGTTIPAKLEAIDNLIDTEVAAILEDTGTTLPATLATIAGYTDGIAGDVWSHKIRTLTNPSISQTTPAEGDPIELYRSVTNYFSLTDLGVMTDQTKLWVTFKENNDLADALAIMQIELTDGLIVLNGSASLPSGITAAEASITVDDETVGSITIRIDQLVSDVLSTYEAYPIYFDVKQLSADDVNLLYQGEAYVYAISTKTIS